MDKLCSLLENVKEQKPLIHCITNPISINQCANAILSLGALPIMAEHPKEIGEITPTADALLINLGNITDARIKSAQKALKTAHKNNIPVILDAVGVACSAIRLKLALKLLDLDGVCILKGNYSEIYTLRHNKSKSRGVDASPKITEEDVVPVCAYLSHKYNCTILASGKTDIVCYGKKTAFIHNGTKRLGSITGTGCMLGAIVTAYATQRQYFEAAVLGASSLGICGEMSDEAKGNGSYLTMLMDNLSNISAEDIKTKMRMDVNQL